MHLRVTPTDGREDVVGGRMCNVMWWGEDV